MSENPNLNSEQKKFYKKTGGDLQELGLDTFKLMKAEEEALQKKLLMHGLKKQPKDTQNIVSN